MVEIYVKSIIELLIFLKIFEHHCNVQLLIPRSMMKSTKSSEIKELFLKRVYKSVISQKLCVAKTHYKKARIKP